jgi:hypothetical protein
MNKVDEVVAECLFRVPKRRAVLRRAKQGAKESASIDVYEAWRRQSLEAEFTQLFDPRSIAGSHVDHRAVMSVVPLAGRDAFNVNIFDQNSKTERKPSACWVCR